MEVWQALLSVRSLVLPRQEDVHTWLKFASLARKSGRIRYVTNVQFLHLILGNPSLIRKQDSRCQSICKLLSIILTAHGDTRRHQKCHKCDCACRQSSDILVSLLGYDPATKSRGDAGYGRSTGRPEVMFGYLKHLWSISSKDGSLDAYYR